MKPGTIIELKSDKRFKLGHIKREGNKLRGHPQTLHMERYHLDTVAMQLNPPIVIGSDLADAIRDLEDKQ